MTSAIDITDVKSETALLKAVRMKQTEMVNIILNQVSNEGALDYQSLLPGDICSKNVLHHAVINKQKSLIERLIYLDSDHSQLRKQKDTKGRLPQGYDESQLYAQIFVN